MKDSIKAGELRKANLIEIRGKVWRIEEIMFDNVRVAREIGKNVCDEEIAPYDDLSPIPLSNEVLEKCGFYCSDSRPIGADNTIMGTCISPFVDGEGIRLWVNDKQEYWFEVEVRRKPVYLKSLHQLQNLFFSILGKELEITL